jgi:hypothetical protein
MYTFPVKLKVITTGSNVFFVNFKKIEKKIMTIGGNFFIFASPHVYTLYTERKFKAGLHS